MIIKGGQVLNNDFKFVQTDVTIQGDTITALCDAPCGDIDAHGCYVVPGFVDTHFHGAVGHTMLGTGPEAFDAITAYMASKGTTTVAATLSAAPKAKLLASIQTAKDYIAAGIKANCADIAAIHLEGPFFSETFKGAHLPENIRNADLAEFQEYEAAAEGLLKIMTMAPELPGADEVIAYAAKQNICISIGHTNATYEQTLHGLDLGARQGTHLFNAMRGLKHRDPGTVGGILYSDAIAELICDFYHVHKDVVKMVYQLKGSDKITMITDCVMGNGLPDGEYVDNGRPLIVKDGKNYTEDGTIAGSSICLIDGVRNLVSIGISLEEACKMASRNPAQTIGMYDKIGSLMPGKRADLVILDQNLDIKHVILRGTLLY